MMTTRGDAGLVPPHGEDFALSALLAIQAFTLFVAIPIGAKYDGNRILLDACHLAFTVVCVSLLTKRRSLQGALLTTVAVLIAGPAIARALGANWGSEGSYRDETIVFLAFVFNLLVTLLVARHVFASGKVTRHRILGAILLYLNVSALFSIAYRAIALSDPGAFAWAVPHKPLRMGDVSAAYSYFSLTTITTTGYGDVVPVHWLPRSLANIEAVFGQLFPATLLTRLITLQLTQESSEVDLLSSQPISTPMTTTPTSPANSR